MKIRLCLIELNFYERLPTISTRVSLLIILKTPCFSDNNLWYIFSWAIQSSVYDNEKGKNKSKQRKERNNKK